MRLSDSPGVVGVIAQDTARFSMFGSSLTSLAVTPGTGIKWVYGHGIAANCNLLVRSFLTEYPNAEWLWLLGDDHAFSPDLLLKLLAHDKDITVPLCLTRFTPYMPVIFSGFDGDGPGRVRVDLDEHPHGGLIEVHSAGSGGMLIRRSVFETMDDPWFESGMSASVEIGEDVYFCDKARELGFLVHADLDANLGHCSVATVWPVREKEGWTYAFSFMGGIHLTLPPGSWQTKR